MGYPTRGPDSLLIPRFNISYMKDSIALKGAVLWNTLTRNTVTLCIQLVTNNDLKAKINIARGPPFIFWRQGRVISGQQEFFFRNLVGIFFPFSLFCRIFCCFVTCFFFLTAVQECFIPFMLHTFFPASATKDISRDLVPRKANQITPILSYLFTNFQAFP